MVALQSIGGRVILIASAATATGRSANILALPGSNENRKAASISAANTLQSTLKVIWKARWKRASELRMRSSRLCGNSFVIVRSIAPGARDTELLALRFVTQRFRSRADHLLSVRSRPLRHSLPTAAVLLCPGLERSTVFAPVTMPAQSEQASRSFVLRSRLTSRPMLDWLYEPPLLLWRTARMRDMAASILPTAF